MTRANDKVMERLSAFGFGEDVMLDPTSLKVPEEFQRDEKARGWKKFVPALFGRLIVVEVDGEDLLVDGQHRNAGAKRANVKVVPAVRFSRTLDGRGMTLADAAAMFDICNSQRVALPAADEFRAAIVSEDEDAIALDEALLVRNLDGTGRGNRSGHPNAETLKSISSVRKLQYDLGLDHTLYTLDVINEIWPFAEIKTSPHVRIVRGFGQFLRPEKTVLASAKGRRRVNRRWNLADRQALVEYLGLRFGPKETPEDAPEDMREDLLLDGMNRFLMLAEARARGGGGGGGSLGMELVLKDMLSKARRYARERAEQDGEAALAA